MSATAAADNDVVLNDRKRPDSPMCSVFATRGLASRPSLSRRRVLCAGRVRSESPK
jgi:hypothetical protein